MPSQDILIEISKMISYHLRHEPKALNLELDLEGFTNLDFFVVSFNQKYESQFGKISEEIIQKILEISDKKRFEIQNNQIRAKYGHSLNQIQLKYPKLEQNITLFHGTNLESLPTIKMEGLKPMARLFVHLTDSLKLAEQTALRKKSKIIILTIDTQKLIQSQEVLVAGFGIYLTGNVSPKFLILC